MTVSSSTRRAGPFNGNDVTTAFPFTFKVFATTDVAVYLTDPDGVQTLLSSGYTVTLNGDQGASPGGTVNYPTAGDPLAAGYKLDLVGSVPYTQGTDITNLGRFLPDVIERAIDKVTILVQQLLEKFARTITFPVGDTANNTLPAASERAGKSLVFDEDGGVTVDDSVALAAASASAAAASEAQTLAYLQAYRATSYGALADDPVLDPNGNPPTVGDEYFNTTDNLLKRFNGAIWQASDISTANLAAANGATLVGVSPHTLGPYVNVQRWIQGNRVVAGRPADAFFSSLQDAVDEGAVLGRGVDFWGTWTLTGSLLLRDRTELRGHGRGSVIYVGDGMDAPAIIQGAVDLTGFLLADFDIDGNKNNQTSGSAGGIYIDNAAGTQALISRHRIRNIFARYCKGDGITFGAYVRDGLIESCNAFRNDGYGFHMNGNADSDIVNSVAGRSGLDGFRINGASSVKIVGGKSWGNGVVTAGSTGYLVRNCNMVSLLDTYSQENSGHGYSLYGATAQCKGLMMSGCTADGDNVQGGNNHGLNINNVAYSRIELAVVKTTIPGTPVNAVAISADSHSNEIAVTAYGQSSTPVAGAGVGGNNVRVNGREASFHVLMDDFLGDVLADQWNGRVGSDPGCVLPTINAQAGGVVRLTGGAGAGANMATNGVQLDSALNWTANQNGLCIEVKLSLNSITDVAVFLGFTDQVAALEMPFTLGAANALTSNATDAVGVLFDTAADADNWWLVGVKADVDAAAVDSGVAPVAATFETWRIVLTNNGSDATFFRKAAGLAENFVQVGATMVNAVSPGALLTPVVAAFSRSASARIINVDMIRVSALRA